MLSEGIPYTVYRLDVKSFYESFNSNLIVDTINSIEKANPQTKSILSSLMREYSIGGGLGLPRGLAFSAVMSEVLMKNFDDGLKNTQGVYFYARYIDDIIIITNPLNNQNEFISYIIKELTSLGLSLNNKKRKIASIQKKIAPIPIATYLAAPPKALLSIDYLGYNFKVYEPQEIKKLSGLTKKQFRDVVTDISASKIKRYKSRIVKSFLDYLLNKNFLLLMMRLKFLTSNFSIKDKDSEKLKMTGIYYNYPRITTFDGLKEMDKFHKNAILCNTGRLFSKTSLLLNKRFRSFLLKQTFQHGHKNRIFLYFNAYDLKQIQECWKYD